jgi:ribosomal protein S18 acetylase RimI-like enzyme
MTKTTPSFAYRIVGEEGFAAVEPLWVKLRAYHSHLPWRFADGMLRFTFEPRKLEILTKAAPGKLRIELVSAASDAADVAYCISTASASGRGEVDSIFVEESLRRHGIGSELIRHALAWLESVGASSKVVTVAYSNEEALALYKRFGFHPRTILLEKNHDNAA